MSRYIDADALGIDYCNPDVFENRGYADGWNSAIKILKEAETAEVEPVRHGHWIFYGTTSKKFFHFYYCSECGRTESIQYDENINEIAPYCHCGAKMDGKETDQ